MVRISWKRVLPAQAVVLHRFPQSPPNRPPNLPSPISPLSLVLISPPLKHVPNAVVETLLKGKGWLLANIALDLRAYINSNKPACSGMYLSGTSSFFIWPDLARQCILDFVDLPPLVDFSEKEPRSLVCASSGEEFRNGGEVVDICSNDDDFELREFF